MKKKILYCIVLLVFTFLSCKKSTNDIATKSNDEILTSQSWQMSEMRAVQNNTPIYYKRGGSSNTVNFDSEVIQFKTDFTGVNNTAAGSYLFTWSFTNTAKTSLKFTIQYSPSFSLPVFWENIIYTETSLRYTEYFLHPLGNTLGEGMRTAK